jgi:4-azaleucine resistance transporter AzlC
MSSPRAEFFSGVKAELPILLGVIPFGMIYGVLALSAGLPGDTALAMSSVVFAGSAQFVGAQLIGAGTPAIIVILTTLVINLRHMLYSASLAPYVKPLKPLWKWLLAYLLTDEAYAVTITYYHRKEVSPTTSAHKHWYFLGAGLTLWSTWQVSTLVGVLLGSQLPTSWALDFSIALTLTALLVPTLKDGPSLASAVVAGMVSVLAAGLPFRLGLLLAALIGILAGLLVELYQRPAMSRRAAPAVCEGGSEIE